MSIPSFQRILKRIKCRNYLFKRCDYYPCHDELETCNFCFCPFYPCDNESTGGEYVISGKGNKVWSCMNCTWAHQNKTVEKVRRIVAEKGNPQSWPLNKKDFE